MSERIRLQRKITTTSAESSQSFIPSIPGVSSQQHSTTKQNITQEPSINLQQVLPEPEQTKDLALQNQNLGHDFSRITIHSRLSTSQSEEPTKPFEDSQLQEVMPMSEHRGFATPISQSAFVGHDFSKISIYSKTQPGHPTLQRKCTACEEEESDLPGQRQIQRAAISPTTEIQENIEAQISSALGGGSSLNQPTQNRLEQGLGTDLSAVRIHTDTQADYLARSVNAVAFTTGQDIFFSSGSYNPTTSEGMHLLTHEVVHTIQQAEGSVAGAPIAGGLTISDPRDSFEQQAEQIATQVMRMPVDNLPPTDTENNTVANTSQAIIVQRFGWEDVRNAASTGANWVGEQAGNVASMGADAFASIVARVAPGLSELIRNGPTGLLTEKIREGIQGWVASVAGNTDIGLTINNLISSLSGAFETVKGVIKGNPAACNAFAESLNGLRQLGEAFMENPVIQQLQTAFNQVSGIFKQVSDAIIAPVFDTLMEVAGGVFNQVKSLASTIWGWGGQVRNFLGAAWDWVKQQLGIGGDSEGGILDWLKSKASQVWSQIKETMAPVIEPLKKVVTVMLAFSPVGLFVIITRYVPPLVEAVRWLWAHKDDENIVRSAHEQMGNTILPQLLSGLQGFSQGMQNAATSFVNQVTQLGESILSLLGTITGVPLLSMAQGMVEKVSNGIQSLVTWGQETFQKAAIFVQEIFEKIRVKVEPYIGVLTSIALAIVNPGMIPVILTGWAWQLLPNCYKAPIINFLLDIVIGILESLPSLPMFGLLWPLFKTGVIGFLQGIKNQDDNIKVAITNKLAKIISGASPAFLFGFVKGFLQGIWEGLTDPFVLIYSTIEGISNLVNWLNSVASQALGDTSQAPATSETATSEASSTEGEVLEATVQPASSESTTPTANPNKAEIGQRMQAMAGELQPPVEQVTQGFMPAIQEIFSGGEGLTFEGLMQKLGEAWAAVESAIQSAAGSLANQVCQFLMQDSAEGAMGESVGWLAGTIVFEVILGILTAGSWTAAKGGMKVLKFFAKVLDWTGEVMGVAFKALAKVGGFILDGIKGLGKLLSNAGGAARAILDALGEIGQKLIAFADELLGLAGRAGRGAAGEVAEETAERSAREAAETAAERAAREASETTAERGGREAALEGAEEVGEEAGERSGRNAASEASERAQALATAKGITAVNERLGTSVPVVIAELSGLKSRYRWINDFEAVPIALGHSRIIMRDVIDDDYNNARSTMLGRDSNSTERLLSESDETYAERLRQLKEDYNPRTKPDGTLETQDEILQRIEDAETRLAEIEPRINDSATNLANRKANQAAYDADTRLWQTKTGKPETLTLPGGRKIELKNPREMSTEDIEAAVARLRGQQGRAGEQYEHLMRELEKRRASEHLRAAQQAYRTGGGGDEDVVRRILEGEKNVWCESREQAQRVSNLIEEISSPGRKAGDFHGPEVHVGSEAGPREIHFNVALKHRGADVKSHIYFPEE